MLSILSFTAASVPKNQYWVDAWVNISTGATITGSRGGDANVPGAYRSSSPSMHMSELDERASPFFEIEVFCIVIFTVEYLTRLCASPAGPGPLRFALMPTNIIDILAILPFYIEQILLAAGSGGSNDLAVLKVLRLIRLTRITRIFKMSKSFEARDAARSPRASLAPPRAAARAPARAFPALVRPRARPTAPPRRFVRPPRRA